MRKSPVSWRPAAAAFGESLSLSRTCARALHTAYIQGERVSPLMLMPPGLHSNGGGGKTSQGDDNSMLRDVYVYIYLHTFYDYYTLYCQPGYPIKATLY